MAEKISFKGIYCVLKNAFNGFIDNKVTKLSGALAYYTVFSLAPLMIIVVSVASIFLAKDAVEGKIYGQLAGFVGHNAAVQLQEIIKNASLEGKSKVAAVIGVIALLIGSTTVFAEIQDSINSIWGLKPKPKRGWLKMIKNRVLSFSVIISLAFLLLVSLGISSIIDGFSDRLQDHFPHVTVVVFYVINLVITFGVTSIIFAVIFRVLPDADIKWKDVMAGAMTTAILFMLGKLGISFYISKSNVGSTYGAAGSLVILLLWVYYSALILYFGAEFTKAYALKYGSKIYPNDYAVTTKMVEIETGSESIQNKDDDEDNSIDTKTKEKASL
ncbi:YihY/virulence factor BrkB family protein [soil metagenome]